MVRQILYHDHFDLMSVDRYARLQWLIYVTS
jgi:hypothetical protein